MTTYRVWFSQVNQAMVEVKAKDRETAVTKAYREWRKHFGHTSVTYVEKQDGKP